MGVPVMLFKFAGLDEGEGEVLARIGELRRELRFHLYEPRRWVGSLRRLNLARNVQGSNSIEGYEASLDDVLAAAAGDTPVAGDETARAVTGYQQAMTYVLGLAGDESFTWETGMIRALHFMMTVHELDKRPGRWRAGPIYIHNQTTGQIVYEGAEATEVPALMEELVEGLREPGDGHPIVRAAMAHLDLVLIHPFRDGNGRMSRCVQTLVLGREEKTIDPIFSSIEEYLGRHTARYYQVLAEVGGPVYDPGRDARPWVRFALTAHLGAALRLKRRIREAEALWGLLEEVVKARRLPQRAVPALFDAAVGRRLRNPTYRELVDEDLNEQSAGRDLRALVTAGLLEARGEGRARSYMATPEFRLLRTQIRQPRDPAEDGDAFGS